MQNSRHFLNFVIIQSNRKVCYFLSKYLNCVGIGYYLHYASHESGQYIYVNRPLKFIELTDEDKDVVAFDLKVEGNSIEKKEYLNISRTETSEATIQKITEDDFNFIKIKSYDPKIWKDYNGLEPLEEMKQFKAD